MRRVISYCVLIFCLEFVASFPYPEEYLEAYQSNNPSLGGGVPRQIQVSNLAHTQNGPSNPTYHEFISRDANTVLQPTRYNNIRYETRPSFERSGSSNVQYPHVEYPSNTNTATPSAIQDMINRETIAQQRQNYENLIRSQQQIHEQLANQMRVQNLPQIQPQYHSREPLLNTVNEPYVSANNVNPTAPQYYNVQQQLPLINSLAQRPFAENTAHSSQNAPIQFDVNHEVPTAPLNRQRYNQWPNKQIANVAPGYNMQNLFAEHPYIKNLLSTTTQRKRYMVIHPNGTVEHVDTLEPVAERHPNYLLLNAGSLPQNYGHLTGHYPQPQAPPATSSDISTSPNSNDYATPYQPIDPTQTTQIAPEPNSIYTAPEAYGPQSAAPAPINPQEPAASVSPETSTPNSATQFPAPQPTVPAPQPTVPAPASAPVERELVTTPATPVKPDISASTDPTKPSVPATSVLAPKPTVPVTPDSTSPIDLPKAAKPASPPSPGPKAIPAPSKTAASPITYLKPAQPTTQTTTSTYSEQAKNINQSAPVTPAKKPEFKKSDPANTTKSESPITNTTPAKPENLTTPTPPKPAPSTSTIPNKRAGSTTPRSPVKPADFTTPTTPSKPADSTAPTSPASPATSNTPTKPAPSTYITPDKRAGSTTPRSPVKPADSTTPTTPSKPADLTATSPASPATSTTPAKPTSSETPVTPVKQTTPKTNMSLSTPKTTTIDKPAASKTPAKRNGPTTSTTPAKSNSSATPTSTASPKKTTALAQASTTPSTAIDNADSPSNKTSAAAKTSANLTESAEPNNDTSMAKNLNPLGVDFSKVKSSAKPVMWFRTSDLDVMSKLTADDEFNVIYFIQVPPQPIIEKDTTKTVFSNGTIVEEITETVWDDEQDEEPRVTKTVTVLNQKNQQQ